MQNNKEMLSLNKKKNSKIDFLSELFSPKDFFLMSKNSALATIQLINCKLIAMKSLIIL